MSKPVSPLSLMSEVSSLMKTRPQVDMRPLQTIKTARRIVRSELVALNYNASLSTLTDTFRAELETLKNVSQEVSETA